MAGRLQNQDLKTLAEITGAGGAITDLPAATKIYIATLGKTLEQAVIDGDLSGGGGVPGGSSGQVQYNNAGAFGGTPNVTWDATNSAFVFGSGNDYVRIASPSGPLGSPIRFLSETVNKAALLFDSYSTFNNQIYMRKARGTVASPTAIQSGDYMGFQSFQGHNGTTFFEGVGIYARAAETWGANRGSELSIYTNKLGTASLIEPFKITSTGLWTDPSNNMHDNSTAISGNSSIESRSIIAPSITAVTGFTSNGSHQSVKVKVGKNLIVSGNFTFTTSATAGALCHITIDASPYTVTAGHGSAHYLHSTGAVLMTSGVEISSGDIRVYARTNVASVSGTMYYTAVLTT